MEFFAAVFGNKMKNFLIKYTDFKLTKFYVLVDSSTVMGNLQKEYVVVRPFKDMRVAEFKSTSEYEDGKLANVAWVSSKHNPADWCTKP